MFDVFGDLASFILESSHNFSTKQYCIKQVLKIIAELKLSC